MNGCDAVGGIWTLPDLPEMVLRMLGIDEAKLSCRISRRDFKLSVMRQRVTGEVLIWLNCPNGAAAAARLSKPIRMTAPFRSTKI